MAKWYIIVFLLCITTSRIFAQDFEMMDVHGLIRQCNKSRPDTGRVQLLLQLSNLYLEFPEKDQHILDTSLLMATQAEELSRRLGYKQGQENAAFTVGKCYLGTKNNLQFQALLKEVSDTSRIKLMLELAGSQLNDPLRTKSGLDTAFLYSRTALALSESIHAIPWKVRSLLQLAGCLEVQGSLPKGKELFQQAFDYSRKNGFIEGEVATYSASSVYLPKDSTLSRDRQHYREQFIADYRRLTDHTVMLSAREKIATGFVDAAINFWDQSNMDQANEELLRGIDFGRICAIPDITSYYNIVYLYLYKSDFKTALSYSLEAVRIVEKDGNKELDERPYMNLGKVYCDMGKKELSITYFNKAMALEKQKGFLINGTLLRMVAEAYLGLNRPEEALPLLLDYLQHVVTYSRIDREFVLESAGWCYFEMKQYDKALPLLLEDVRLAEQSPGVMDRYNAYEVLGKVYARKKNYYKARHYFQQVLQNDTTSDLLILKRTAHRVLSYVDSASGNYLSAMEHYKAYKKLDDSSFNTAHHKEIEELKIQYETEKKDQYIGTLTKETRLQSENARQARYLRNGLIGGACMLFLLLTMMYARYRNKQKTNRLLEVQQEEIKRSNHALQLLNGQQQKLLSEKEWLIKEVHHRVKNNLQLVISLLNMQSHYLKDEFAQHAFDEIGRRIRTISLIHQKLYQIEDMATINMKDYVCELVSYLEDSCVGMQPIYFDLQIDPVELDASQTVPIGLILNESITNAIKYAFSGRTNAKILISMKKDPASLITLTIADNGKGLPDDFYIARPDSMGMELITMLSEQLEGELDIVNDDGVSITVRFQQQVVMPKSGTLLPEYVRSASFENTDVAYS